jgi:hypothetical protein
MQRHIKGFYEVKENLWSNLHSILTTYLFISSKVVGDDL